MRLVALILIIPLFMISCESAKEKENRKQLEDQARIELNAENQRLEEERKLAEKVERKAQELYNRYINNSLSQEDISYPSCFGGKKVFLQMVARQSKLMGLKIQVCW